MHKAVSLSMFLLVASIHAAENNDAVKPAEQQVQKVELRKAPLVALAKTIRNNPLFLWMLIADGGYGVSKITLERPGIKNPGPEDKLHFSAFRWARTFAGIGMSLDYAKTLAEEISSSGKPASKTEESPAVDSEDKKAKTALPAGAKVALALPLALIIVVLKHPALTAHVATDWWYSISSGRRFTREVPSDVVAMHQLFFKSLAAGSATVLATEYADALLHLDKVL